MAAPTDTIRVLHVDDDPDFAEVTAAFLARADDTFSVTTATSAEAGLSLLEDADVDCIVSDYDMPGRTGIEFLRAVRTRDPDVPFILFTGKGSEEVASEAISAGVTDYLQKGTSTGQYSLLANRVRNAVDRHMSERQRRRWKQAVETATEGIAIIDGAGRFVQVNDAYAATYGVSPTDMIATDWREWYPNEEVARFEADILPALERNGTWTGGSVGIRDDGSRVEEALSLSILGDGGHVCVLRDVTERREREHELAYQRSLFEAVTETGVDGILVVDEDREYVAWNGRFVDMWDIPEAMVGDVPEQEALEYVLDSIEEPEAFIERVEYLYEHPDEESRDQIRLTDGRVFDRFSGPVRGEDGTHFGRVWFFRDITDHVERERALERQYERLDGFTSIASHDLRNPLNVAEGHLDLTRETGDIEHLAAVEDALERMTTLIDDLLELARDADGSPDTAAVELANLVETCWGNVETRDATLVVQTDATILAEKRRLTQLVENLVGNSVEHGGDAVTVTVGDLPGGFYVEDDGRGVPANVADRVFERGFSTSTDGTGFGLGIVRKVAAAHGWDVELAEGEDGGARIEMTGVGVVAG